MATTKHLDPTNVDISIPAMTDQPNASVFSNCVDKEADAINALNTKIANSLVSYVDITDSTPVNVNSQTLQAVGKANFISAVSTEDGIMCLPYVNSGIMYVKLVNFSDLSAVTGNHTIRVMYRT